MKKSNMIAIGGVIAVLIGGNGYLYHKNEKMSSQYEKLDIAYHEMETLYESVEASLSHDDMKIGFNSYGFVNKIIYKNEDYLFDVQDVIKHTYDETKPFKYTAEANVAFLKDKSVDGRMYLQDLIVDDLSEKFEERRVELEEALGHEHNHEHHEGEHEEHEADDKELHVHDDLRTLPKHHRVKIENEVKSDYVVATFNQSLTFNSESGVFQTDEETNKRVLASFVKEVVLKGKKETEVLVEKSESGYKIEAVFDGEKQEFVYDAHTRQLK